MPEDPPHGLPVPRLVRCCPSGNLLIRGTSTTSATDADAGVDDSRALPEHLGQRRFNRQWRPLILQFRGALNSDHFASEAGADDTATVRFAAGQAGHVCAVRSRGSVTELSAGNRCLLRRDDDVQIGVAGQNS